MIRRAAGGESGTEGSPARGFVAAAVVGLLVLLAAATARGSMLHLQRVVPPAEEPGSAAPTVLPTASPPALPTGAPGSAHSHGFDLGGAHLFGWVVLAGVLYLLFRLVRTMPMPQLRRPPAGAVSRGPAVEPLVALREEVEGALDAVRLEPDARTAIVRCWERLELAAAAAGTARRPSETSRQLLGRLLDEQHVDPGALHRLADLYAAARFSPHRPDGTIRDEAQRALDRLRYDLGAGVTR